MKNIVMLVPFLLVMQGCHNEPNEDPVLKAPTPSDIALQATEKLFKLHIDVQERTKEKESKVKSFTTKYQDNICEVDVDSETLMVVNMSCKIVKSTQNEMFDKYFTPAGKEMYQKTVKENSKE